MNQESVRIVIGGDLCPAGKVEALFGTGESSAVFYDLLPIFDAADYSVVNLECPLISEESPISKDGATLGAPPSVTEGLRGASIDAVNLANNHIMDHGEQGLTSTIKALTDAEISFFGAGSDLMEASRPHLITKRGKTIALVGVAEHEFSIAGDSKAGANPLDVVENARLLRQLKQDVDWIVLLLHGGKEHYPYPTPKLQKVCRFYSEEGADAVVVQHTHIAGCYEFHNQKPIVYGQGNLVFEKVSRDYASWFEGVLVGLTFGDHGVELDLVPYEQSRGMLGAKRLQAARAEILLGGIEERSRQVCDVEFVKNEWQRLCEYEARLYKSRLLGHNRYLRYLDRLFNFSRWTCPQWKMDMIRNVVECETHREGLETLWRDCNDKF